MKIGVFDSGVGGLLILRSLVRELPQYDYVYLGDTARVPYGNRSRETIYGFLREAVDALFARDCELIIVACNTASAEALRRIQQEYLPKKYPGRGVAGSGAQQPSRRVLGIIIPTAEIATQKKEPHTKSRRIGILATQATVRSGTYNEEIKKLDPQAQIFSQAAPLLVPLIEVGARSEWIEPILRAYLAPLLRKKVDTIILGCTHYPALKHMIKKIAGSRIHIVSQEEIISGKLKDYLARHPEIKKRLNKNRRRELLVTDITPGYEKLARKWFGVNLPLRVIKLEDLDAE